MKTKFLRIGKSSLSMTLSLMMIVSTVFFGSFGTADAITTSDTASVDVVEDAVADINVDVEEADDAFADTTAIDETVSADVAAEDTAVDDKSVTVESSSVSTSVTTTNTKKTEKKTPEVSKADAPVASGYARIYFANNIVTNWKVPKVHVYDSCEENNTKDGDFKKSYVMTKSSTYDGLYYIDLKTETDGSIKGKLIFNGTANPSRGGTQTWDFGVYSNPLSISAGKVAVPYYITQNTKGQYGIRFAWVELNSSYCHRLYFDNSYTNWDTVCAYCSGENKNDNTWPGQKMNYDGSSWYVNVYGDTDTINKSLSTCLIFNNGNGSQTVDITGAANNLDKIWKANSYDGTKYSGSWSAYTGSSSSTGTSANVDYHFIYGNNNDPRTFTNELPILKDSNNKYYVELPTEYGINYYFGISGSTSYKNLYVQNSTPDQNITVTNSSASNVSTESKINYIIGDYTYYCSRVSTKSASVESVIIYINDPGHNYTVSSNLNEHIKTSGPVTVVAKTGTVRNEFEKYSELSEIISLNYTDTSNSIDQSQNPGKHWSYTAYSGGQRVWIADNVERNREIEYTVQIKSDYKDTYYVKAFCINGETYGITNGASSDGKYTCKFTIDNDDEGPIEITPIYYYIEKAGEEYITLAVEDFSGDVKKLWGNTIACYAYYVGGNDKAGAAENNKQALGGYPGQPMVYINGSYYMQIPKKISNGSVIEGITLNNYVWDDIHARKLVGVQLDKDHRDDPTTAQIQARNCQTYDYDDFAALRESRSANKIIFNFKYRTYNNNDSKTDYPEIGNQPQKTNDFNMSFVTSKGGNGWDALVDYYDVPVDLFARRLVDENNKYLTDTAVKNKAGTDEVVYVVSDGYVAYYSHADDTAGNYAEGTGNGKTINKYVGQYATRWYVYTKNSDDTYKYIGALPPSAFLTGLTKDGDSANAKTYTPGDYTKDNFVNYANKHEAALSNAFSQWSDYENIYKACAGKPVVITYESNIYSNGVKGGTGTGTYRNDYDETYYYGTTQNPGYRCDGRWYYSKYNQTINATTKIKIIKKDSSGNVVTDDEGQIVYDDDTYKSTDPNVGTKTGASAYFTNTTANSLGKSYYGATSTTVYEDENDSFKFKSSSNTTGKYTFKGENEESNVIYKFVGWYLETGSGLLNPISKDVTGSRQMDSSANFVAVYEPVKVTERSLFIEHELYADLYDSLSSKEGVTAPKNGTGTPYIDSVVITKDNQTLYSNKTKVNGSVIVINDNDSNALVNGATVTVTLSATPANSDTTFDGVYIPKSEGGYVENNYRNISTIGTKANGDVTIATTSNGTTTYTYTYTISDELFTDNKATLSHYSDFSTTLLSINFKYYDRVTSPDSHTETISTTPSTVNVSASATAKEDSNSKSIANAITNALGEASKDKASPMKTLENVIDNYYFWTSTNEATEGIKDFINYHVVDKDATNTTDITERYHTTYAKDYGTATDENDKAILSYHLDCYGVPYKGLIDAENPSNADGYSAEAWVTYTKTDGSAPVTYKSTDNVDLTTVKSVTVWGYNAPRTYKVSLYKPTDYNSFETVNNGVYYTKTIGVTPSEVTAFYNQRLAGKDENYDGSNSPSDYLTQYGITTGYFGDDSAVTADEEITFADGETKVVFDGWYDANTHTKISSDRTYGYRVTTNLSLVAGYKSSKTSDTTKVSVIKNGVEPFIDADNQSRVRLTTVVNVYDNLDTDANSENYLNPKDKDENIKKVSAIYVQLPVKDSNGEQIIWNSDNLAALKLDSTTEGIGKAVRDYLTSLDLTSNEVKNSDTLTVTVTIDNVTINTEKIISYTYDVTFDSDDIDTNTTMLTNKNRVQFTLPMKAELYYGTGDVAGSNSAIIAYAAIYYDATDNDTADGSWIVSENHAEFIADVVKPKGDDQ